MPQHAMRGSVFPCNLEVAPGVYVENEKSEFELRGDALLRTVKRLRMTTCENGTDSSLRRRVCFPIWSHGSMDQSGDGKIARPKVIPVAQHSVATDRCDNISEISAPVLSSFGPNNRSNGLKCGERREPTQAHLTGKERACILFPSLSAPPDSIRDDPITHSSLVSRPSGLEHFDSDTDLDSEISQELDAFIKDGVAIEGRVRQKRCRSEI